MFDNILKSGSKIVLILITVTACTALFTGHLEGKDFMLLATGVFTFYFSNKGDNSKPYLDK